MRPSQSSLNPPAHPLPRGRRGLRGLRLSEPAPPTRALGQNLAAWLGLDMGGHANARVRGFLHSTTRYMYLEHGCTRFCAGGGRWPGRRNEKGPKYVPNKETRYKMRAHAQRWYRTVVPAAPGRAWGTTWPGPTDTNPPGTIWGRPGAVTGHYEYNNNDNIQKPHASSSGPFVRPPDLLSSDSCRKWAGSASNQLTSGSLLGRPYFGSLWPTTGPTLMS